MKRLRLWLSFIPFCAAKTCVWLANFILGDDSPGYAAFITGPKGVYQYLMQWARHHDIKQPMPQWYITMLNDCYGKGWRDE